MELLQPEDPPPSNPNPSNRKPLPKSKSKAKPLSKKKQALINSKLSLLSRNLRPFPFPQTLTLTLDPHEPLLRSLHLWDFATLPLDSLIRTDLLADLIAHYDPLKHHSLVRGLRLNLSRADLGRALSLPKPSPASSPPFDAAPFGGLDQVSAVLSSFISTRMVFLEDAAILPSEVVNVNRLVKEGKFDKVDWAGMMWALVEREILAAPECGSCYYASHIQCLMKYQKPRLFEEMEVEPLEVSEATGTVEDDGEEDGDVESEKCGPGLSLGVGEENEEESGEKEEDGDNKGKMVAGDNGLGEENIYDDKGKMVVDDNGLGDEKFDCDKGKMVVDDNGLGEKFSSLERLTSSDFMQVMGTGGSLSFGLEQANGDFLAMGSDMHGKGVGLDLGPTTSFLFGNEGKRPMEEDEEEDHSNQQKRFRTEQPWEQEQAELSMLDFDGCVDTLQSLLGKARMNILEKKKECMNVEGHLQYLSGIMQQKDDIIQSLEKDTMEVQQRRDMEASRFAHDLRTLSHVLFGCKRALKETQMAFAEYRKKYPLVVEKPTECHGNDGNALAVNELGKLCSTDEEEAHRIARTMINDFYKSWSESLNKYATKVSESATKLVKLWDEVKLLKEMMAKAKIRIVVE